MMTIREYARPATLEEAWQLNQKKPNRVLGGMLWLKMEKINVGTAIDLSALGLDTIEETDTEIIIGAMATLRDLETNAALNAYTAGAVRETVRHIVGVQFRNCATVGGSVFGRFGFSDVLTALLALDCEVELAGAGVVSLASFVNMPYERDVLAHVIVHKHDYAASFAAVRRSATDFPVLNVCAARWDGWHVAVGARPTRARLLEGERLALPDDFTPEQLDAACERLSELPMGSNMRGSERYRRHLARELGRRAIRQAAGLEAPSPDPVAPAPRTVCAGHHGGDAPSAPASAGDAAPAHDPAPTQAPKGGDASCS